MTVDGEAAVRALPGLPRCDAELHFENVSEDAVRALMHLLTTDFVDPLLPFAVTYDLYRICTHLRGTSLAARLMDELVARLPRMSFDEIAQNLT
jgi:hypothetical protein